MDPLRTARLSLEEITLPLVEAVLADKPREVERLADARLADRWPGRALIERAFCASIERIRAAPTERLWGDRLMIETGADGERHIVGSVVFHGAPDARGEVEIGYGVEASRQGMGYGAEAVCAVVDWALEQPGVRRVAAATFPWHTASIRILRRAGMLPCGTREHDMLGDLLLFERVAGPARASQPTSPRPFAHR